jgi:hypothetical protein
MKTVINNNDGFRTILEIKDVQRPTGYKQIRFLTEWDGARRDGSAQTQFELVLSPTQLANLKDLL